jgi:hypothetical protein
LWTPSSSTNTRSACPGRPGAGGSGWALGSDELLWDHGFQTSVVEKVVLVRRSNLLLSSHRRSVSSRCLPEPKC